MMGGIVFPGILIVMIDQLQTVAKREPESGNFIVVVTQNDDRWFDLGFLVNRWTKIPMLTPGEFRQGFQDPLVLALGSLWEAHRLPPAADCSDTRVWNFDKFDIFNGWLLTYCFSD